MSYWSVVAKAEGHWPLQDDAANGTVLAETGPNGVMFGGSTTADKSTEGPTGWLPRALSFNGVADYIATGQTSGSWSSGTMTAWVRPAGVQTSYCGVISRRSQLTLWASADGRYHYNWSDAPAQYLYEGPAYSLSQWRHVALRVRPNGVDFFQDGELAASNMLSHSARTQSNPLCIGSDPFTSARFFQGDLAGVSVYDHALSDNEIAELMAGPEPTNTTPPALIGEAIAGGRLGLSAGLWDDRANGSVTLQPILQVSSDNGTSWADADWSVGQEVALLPESFVGQTIRLAVVATNSGGESEIAFSPTIAVGPDRLPAALFAGGVASGGLGAGLVSASGGSEAGQVIPSEI